MLFMDYILFIYFFIYIFLLTIHYKQMKYLIVTCFSCLYALCIRENLDRHPVRCVIVGANLNSNTNICQLFCYLLPGNSPVHPHVSEGIPGGLSVYEQLVLFSEVTFQVQNSY